MQKRLPTILAASLVTIGISPCLTYAQGSSIEARITPKGGLVYANRSVENPTPPPKAVSPIPVPGDPIKTPLAPADKLQAAIAAVNAPKGQGSRPAGSTAVRVDGAEIARLVNTISLRNGVDPDLVAAVIRTESNYDQWAISQKGARGLMQLMPATGQRFGVEDFFDARQNIEGGVKYLRILLEKFDGNVDLSLAAYNAGEGLVERLGRVPPIDETRNYVTKIRSVYTKKNALLLPLNIEEPAPPAPNAPAAPVNAIAAQAPSPPPAVAGGTAATAPASTAKTEVKPVVLPEVSRISSRTDARGVTSFSNVD
jgi:hypothetical protein